MPYTIVLAPPEDSASKYTKASQELYKDYHPSYLLSLQKKSFPHITVVQFSCDSPEVAYHIWYEMCDKIKEEQFEPFIPPFVGISFIQGVECYEGTTWVELSIARGDKASPIMKVHETALKVLKSFDVEPLNASGNNYRPHLTLARIVMPKQQMPVWEPFLFLNPGLFRLEFGQSDAHWQYLGPLATFP